MTLRSNLDDLAASVAEKAQKTETPLQDSTDALKALTALYTALEKNRGQSDDGNEDTPSFEHFSKSLQEPVNGSPEIRDRRGRQSRKDA
jgi:hypothetical protein